MYKGTTILSTSILSSYLKTSLECDLCNLSKKAKMVHAIFYVLGVGTPMEDLFSLSWSNCSMSQDF